MKDIVIFVGEETSNWDPANIKEIETKETVVDKTIQYLIPDLSIFEPKYRPVKTIMAAEKKKIKLNWTTLAPRSSMNHLEK